jgi:hypothetical protein
MKIVIAINKGSYIILTDWSVINSQYAINCPEEFIYHESAPQSAKDWHEDMVGNRYNNFTGSM